MKGKYDHAPPPGYEIEKRLHASIYTMPALFAIVEMPICLWGIKIYIVSLYMNNIEYGLFLHY